MKLDFTVLSRPASAPPASRTWGQVGTRGTRAIVRVPASQAFGDGPGTPGDNLVSPATQGITVAADVRQDGACCPPPSPPCPRVASPGKPNEIKVSPVSPLVPGLGATTDQGDEFEHEAFEERAAIMEFDGGMTRPEAEAAARIVIANARRNHADE